MKRHREPAGSATVVRPCCCESWAPVTETMGVVTKNREIRGVDLDEEEGL
jgi:hypothetical protein